MYVILEEKTIQETGRPSTQCSIRTKIWLRCDYCGVEFQRDIKSRKRLNKNLGKDSCGQMACREHKKKEVNELLYGCSNPFASEEVKQKIKQTNVDRYGAETYLQSADFQKKRTKGLISRYGVNSPLKSKAIRDKQEETCLEKYGAKNASMVPEFIEKRKSNNIQRYGVESPSKLEEVKKKRTKTNRERYQADNYTQTKEHKEKKESTCLEKYGVKHPWASKEIRAKSINTMNEKYGGYYSTTKEFKEKYREICMQKYGVPNPLLLNQKYGKTQKEIQEWINSLGFNFMENYSILEGKEVDLYDEKIGLGIEYCGLFWHTELSPAPRNHNYHYQKYKSCLEKGVRLITIFEDEWKSRNDQCRGLLQSILGIFERKIYARSCSVSGITKKQLSEFVEAYHIQKANKSSVIAWGLFVGEELIGVLSLGRHPRNQQIVLDRMCFKSGVQIAGGASKLFSVCKQWCVENNIDTIITWSDNRWSQGKVYEKMGFLLDEDLKPDYSYVDLKRPYIRISKQSQKKSNTDCPNHITEREYSANLGLARIWDCGKKRWKFTIT